MMSLSSTSEIYDFVLSLIKEIGEVMKEGFYTKLNVETKNGISWDVVTEYDRKVEDFLIKKISEKYPNHKFIAEETSFKTNIENILTDEPTWIIDPIDGTLNYIRGNPMTCISVGFLIDKEITIGIVYNPIRNELFTAQKGSGAFLNDQRIYTSKVTELEFGVIGHEISMAAIENLYEKNIKRLETVVKKSQGVVSYNCVAMSLCYVANGSLDGYHVDDLYPWDMAAGVLIVREAGGYVLNPTGSDFDIMKPNIVCAGTEVLCRELVSLFKDVNIF